MKVAIYTRKSVAVENSESIDTQINLCKNYFKGENEFEVFEDEGFSGGNTNRPAFKRLMNLIKLGKFEAVAIYKVDRISRNIVDFFKIYEELEKYNVKLISISEGFDPSTPAGKMLMIMLSAFADMERENIRQRVKDNMISLAKKGCFTGGFTPFGYSTEKYEGKSYLVVNEDIEAVKVAYETYLKLGSLYSTHKYLEEMGYKTVKSRTSLGKLLRSPVYAQSSIEINNYLEGKGFEVVGSPNKKGYMTYGKTTGYPTLIVGKHTTPITSELWLKVNLKMDDNKEIATKRESKTYWLTETLYCPFCGGKYQLVNSGKNTYYVCQNRINRNDKGFDTEKEKCSNNKYINAEQIEKDIEELIESFEDEKTFLKGYKNASSTNTLEEDIKRLEGQIEGNNKAINSLVDKMILMSTDTAHILTEKIEDINKKNTDLKAKLEDLKLQQIENVKKSSMSETYKNIVSFGTLKTNKEKRIAIRKIFGKITFNPFDGAVECEFI